MAGTPKRRADKALLDALTTGDCDDIFERISNAEPLRSIADRYKVSRGVLASWLTDDDERHSRYIRARIQSASALAEQALECADASTPETVACDKLRMGARQWLASRWDRTTYGDQKQADVTVNVNMLHLDALRHVNARRNQQIATDVKCIDGSVTIEHDTNSK